MKKVSLLINKIPSGASVDEIDVLTQADFVSGNLLELGYATRRVFLDLNLEQAAKTLKKQQPHFVFNLVESINSCGKLIHLAPALLEHLQISFTGCRSEAMFVSTNKVLAKKWLQHAGLPTPAWFDSRNAGMIKEGVRYIAKPLWEDASVGIGDENILEGNMASVGSFLEQHRQHEYFFEEYLEGREFNISVLGGTNGPQVLPMAEIVFSDYPPGKPRIVGYEAKWQEGSFEYDHTVRGFGIETENPQLARQLKDICIQCWHLFKLSGYARIDLRLDRHNNPQILEINANPCLSPDAGFFAAATQAGFSGKDMIKRICEDLWMHQI